MSKFTPEQKLTLIKHLAGGKSADVVATIMHATREAVIEVARNHGYPDTDKLSWAADVMAKNLEASTEDFNDAPLAERGGVTRPSRPVAAVPHVAQPVVPVAPTDEVMATLNKAKGHSSKRIQVAANKALDAISKVRQLVVEDEQKHHERRKAERERAAARAEVERLKQELAAAQAKLRGRAAEPAPEGGGEFGCGSCERTFGSAQGLAVHQGRAHAEPVAS